MYRLVPLAVAVFVAAPQLSPASAATVRLEPVHPQVGAALRGCARIDAAASLHAPPLEIPAIAAAQHAFGVSEVRVDLDARGRLVAESLARSSGNRNLDDAAQRTARLSHYSAEVRNCAAVAGSYRLIVDFGPDDR